VLFRSLGAGAGLSLRAGIAWLSETDAALLASLLVLPWLAAYFAWRRRTPLAMVALAAAAAVVVAAALVLPPFDLDGMTIVLAGIHAPVALWLLVGVVEVGQRWRDDRARMDFIRFSGEWAVYYALLALGGGVLIGLTMGAFAAIDIDASPIVLEWVLPCGAAGAVLVAAWLVEAKKSVIENIAPVLTRVFTPLTTLMLAAVLIAFGINLDVLGVSRDLLILMTAILVVVLALFLYTISAQDPDRPVGLFGWLLIALVGAAVAVDAMVLVAMLSRIAEFGATANKVAALGLNLLLLVNLVRACGQMTAYARGRAPLAPVVAWQTAYLPVYLAWAAFVVVALPSLFDYA
jgi:hypothetical protein